MLATVIISVLTCVLLILSVLFFPKVKIFNKQLNTYFLVCLAGALLILAFNCISFSDAFNGLTVKSDINPFKILILFISMTFLSVFLDEVGFFSYLASFATKKAKSNQLTLFLVLYALVSVLTVFTSNDIVILTFTPFICYFAKNTKINPIPYLVAEFAAANTWSMMLIIGNPTNIYLATAWGINFIDYLKVMAIPTIFAGLVELLIMYLLFNKQLKTPLNYNGEEVKIKDKPSLIIGLAHLGLCLITLVISSYVDLPMWIICFAFAISLIIFSTAFSLYQKKPLKPLTNTAKRLPWDLIPFVLSMFIIVLALNKQGVTEIISSFLGDKNVIFSYGYTSYLACNLINNIPMSVLYSTIPNMSATLNMQAVYSTIIGSNIGAFLTPIGALAGIMFTGLVTKHNVKYSFKTFILYGIIISVPTISTALLTLTLMI